MLSRELCPIDWTQSLIYVIDQVRGLIPWPCATAQLDGNNFKIFRTEIGHTTDKAPGTILAADKRIVERDKVLDMLDEIIAQLPVELKQSRTIVESRNELIGQARREAETTIRQAQEKADKMVEEEAIYQEAKRQCQEMVLQTQTRMAELRKASNDYVNKKYLAYCLNVYMMPWMKNYLQILKKEKTF